LRAPANDVLKGRDVAHKDDRYEGLPATWPFRVAGTLFIVAFAWFCFGFAVEDMGDELHNHKPVFWLLLLAGIVFVVGGAIYNLGQSRARRRLER
jgi:thiosulfate reductase cytochrome b subunit